MEDSNNENIAKKRPRDDSIINSDELESKRSRVDSPELHPVNSRNQASESSRVDSVAGNPKLDRVDSASAGSEISQTDSPTPGSDSDRVDSVIENPEFDSAVPDIVEMSSPDTIKITEDILNILDDSDNGPEIQDLDSVIKSFEEEINNPDPGSDSVELDYLYGASDDELGLPPVTSPAADELPENSKLSGSDQGPEPDPLAVEVVENFSFVDELPSYDTFGFGIDDDNNNGDFITVGGIFDFSEATDYSSRRSESLSAL